MLEVWHCDSEKQQQHMIIKSQPYEVVYIQIYTIGCIYFSDANRRMCSIIVSCGKQFFYLK